MKIKTTVTEDGEIIPANERPPGGYVKIARAMHHALRTPGNYDTNAASDETAIKDWDPSLTIQSQAEDTDINLMIKRYGREGAALANSVPMPPTLEDFQDVTDFQSALNTIRLAQESFNALRPDVRARFNNDPHQFLAHVDSVYTAPDSKRRERDIEELVEMGLAVDRRTPPVDPAARPSTPLAPAGGEEPVGSEVKP